MEFLSGPPLKVREIKENGPKNRCENIFSGAVENTPTEYRQYRGNIEQSIGRIEQ